MEDNKYEQVISRYNDTQLMHAETILEEEEAILYKKKKAIKEERYEDAAKIRDEIKKIKFNR